MPNGVELFYPLQAIEKGDARREILALAYFRMGGLHVGIGIASRETLEDAMRNPEKYKSLTVRLYDFSEHFASLPEWQ